MNPNLSSRTGVECWREAVFLQEMQHSRLWVLFLRAIHESPLRARLGGRRSSLREMLPAGAESDFDSLPPWLCRGAKGSPFCRGDSRIARTENVISLFTFGCGCGMMD